jgi:hypothetical protein
VLLHELGHKLGHNHVGAGRELIDVVERVIRQGS